MQARTSRIVFDYWNEVRGSRIAPRRLEIEPSRIAEVLHETFILERGEDGSYRFRLAGTRLCKTFGGELRGMSFLDWWHEADRADLVHAMDDACRQGSVLCLDLEATSGNPARVARFEALLLPLIHLKPDADRMLGAMTPLEAPYWLGDERIVGWQLLRKEVVWPDGRPRAIVDAAGHQAPFLPQIRHARLVRSQHRQFRVYDGGLTDGGGD